MYAGVLSGKLADNYANLEKYVSDAFNLTAQARLSDARMLEILGALSDGGHVTAAEVRRAAELVRTGREGDGPEALDQACAYLDEMVERAEQGDRSWREWRELADLKRRLAETHANQRAKEHGPVTWTDVALVAEALKRGILRFVPREEINEYLEWTETLRATSPALDALLGKNLSHTFDS